MGIKDSSGDLSLTAEYVRVTPDDFGVLKGRDTLILVGLLYGCAGAIAATANVVPRLVVDIYERSGLVPWLARSKPRSGFRQ